MDHIPSPKILTIDPNDDNIILEIPEDKDPTAPETPSNKKEKVKQYLRLILLFFSKESKAFNSYHT